MKTKCCAVCERAMRVLHVVWTPHTPHIARAQGPYVACDLLAGIIGWPPALADSARVCRGRLAGMPGEPASYRHGGCTTAQTAVCCLGASCMRRPSCAPMPHLPQERIPCVSACFTRFK